ncbi:MAG: pyridoxamine 5'-phosphate oxidase family protein [Lautropia sp.]
MTNSPWRPVDGQGRELARQLMIGTPTAALATIEPACGWPYSSLVNVASAADGALLILVSRLSVHTQALARDPRCSLLLADAGHGDPLAHPRLTVFGRAVFLDRDTEEHRRARHRFLDRHPQAERYADFSDFSFTRIQPERALLNAGFGRASELAASDLLPAPAAGETGPPG